MIALSGDPLMTSTGVGCQPNKGSRPWYGIDSFHCVIPPECSRLVWPNETLTTVFTPVGLVSRRCRVVGSTLEFLLGRGNGMHKQCTCFSFAISAMNVATTKNICLGGDIRYGRQALE